MSFTKNTSAFYIKVKNVEDPTINEIYENQLIDFFSKNFELGDEKYIAFGYKNDSIFLFVEEYKIKLLLSWLEKKDLILSYKDISNDIINGDIYDSEEFNHSYNNDEEFKKVFDKFILENVDVDNILDKINRKGIECLTEIDRIILKS